MKCRTSQFFSSSASVPTRCSTTELELICITASVINTKKIWKKT